MGVGDVERVLVIALVRALEAGVEGLLSWIGKNVILMQCCVDGLLVKYAFAFVCERDETFACNQSTLVY